MSAATKPIPLVVSPAPASVVLDDKVPVQTVHSALRPQIPAQAAGRPRGRPSGVATILLGPLGVTQLQETGDRFVILSSNLPVKIKPEPAGREETYYAGTTGVLKETFNFLSIKNPSTTASLVLMIWVGFEHLVNNSPPAQPVTPMELLTVIAVTNTIQPVSTVDLYFRVGWFYAYASFTGGVPANNLANIQLGRSKTFQPDQLAPGQWFSYALPDRQLFNLANIFVQGTAGDGVFFTGT